MTSNKFNLMHVYKSYYTASISPEIAEFGEICFLVIEGRGAPGGTEFKAKVSALYSVAYAVKNLMKKLGKDFVIPKLEGMWWVESSKEYWEVPREEWRWKLLIRLPEFVSPEIVDRAKGRITKKKRPDLVGEVRYERIRIGLCVQILHVGPYSSETRSIDIMHKFMEENGLMPDGPHHEIYLSDPRRTPEHRLKTILRQSVKIRQ